VNIIQDIMDILTAPFAGPLDLEQLFLITGLVLFFIIVWFMILYHIRLAAEEIS
jgi:hypothetical protein